jgi:hypothetical protein
MTIHSTKAALITALCLAGAAVQASPITVSSATPAGSAISQGSLALATDGSTATGYLVRNNLPEGFYIRFDFDISEYSHIDAFSLDFTGVYSSDNSAFQSLRFGASPYSSGLFTNVSTPIGSQVTFNLSTTSAGSGFADTDNYISGSTLSVYVQTEFGSSSFGTYTSINTLELTADIQGTSTVEVPEPGTLSLLALAAGLGLVTRRKQQAA